MLRHITWTHIHVEAHEVCPTMFMQELFKKYIERSIPVGETEPRLDVTYWVPGNEVHATLEANCRVANMDVLMANLYLDVQKAQKQFPDAKITICHRGTRYPTNWLAQSEDAVLYNTHRDGNYLIRVVEEAVSCNAAVTLAEDVRVNRIRSLQVMGEPFTARKIYKEIKRQALLRDNFIDLRKGSEIYAMLESNVMIGITAQNGQFHVVDERRVHVTYTEFFRATNSPWINTHYDILYNMEQLKNGNE